jgi:hypothetical protein
MKLSMDGFLEAETCSHPRVKVYELCLTDTFVTFVAVKPAKRDGLYKGVSYTKRKAVDLFCPEKGGSMYVRNICTHLPDQTVS